MGIDYEYLHDTETRATDAATGGQKGVKLTQIGALDPVALIELGRVAGMGANKYAAFNYLRGFDWANAYNAMQRHANLFWSGEDRDPESGLPHIAHAAWMALALLSFYMRGIGTDSRPPRLPEPLPDDTGMSPEDAAQWLADMGIQPMTRAAVVAWLGMDLSGGESWSVAIPEEWGSGDGPIYTFGARPE